MNRTSWLPTWGPRDYVQIIKARRVIVAGTVLAALVVSLVYSWGDTEVDPSPTPQTQHLRVLLPTSTDLPDAGLGLEEAKQILLSQEIADRLEEAVGTEANDLLVRLQVNTLTEVDVLFLAYSDTDRDRGARALHAFANAIVEEHDAVLNSLQEEIEREAEAEGRRIDRLERQIRAAGREGDIGTSFFLASQVSTALSRLAALEDEAADLRRLAVGARVLGPVLEVPPQGLSTIDPVTGEPTFQADPATTEPTSLPRSLIAAAIVGLILGIGIALVQELLDPRLRTLESMQLSLELPLLAEVSRHATVAEAGSERIETLLSRSMDRHLRKVALTGVRDEAVAGHLFRLLSQAPRAAEKGSQEIFQDAGSILGDSDGLSIAADAEAVVLIVRLHESARDAARAVDEIRLVNGNVVGLVALI